MQKYAKKYTSIIWLSGANINFNETLNVWAVFPAIYLHKAIFKVIEDMFAVSIIAFLDNAWNILSHRNILEEQALDEMRTNTVDSGVEIDILHFPTNIEMSEDLGRIKYREVYFCQ